MKRKYFDLQPEVLENELIHLLPLRESDFERLFEVACDPMIWELHPEKDRYKKEIFRRYFESAVASGSAFVVIDKASDVLIGSTRFYDLQPDYSKVAIGYTFLAKKYWGGLYNRAMKNLLINYAFQFVDSVVFHIGITNFRSQNAILKIGAKKTEAVDFSGSGKLTHFTYEINKSD